MAPAHITAGSHSGFTRQGSAARLKLAGTAKRAHLKRDPLRRSHPTQMSRGSRSSTYAIPAGDSSTSPVASSYSRSRSR